MRAHFGLRLFLQRFVVACAVVGVLTAGVLVVVVAGGSRFAKHEFTKRTVVRLAGGILAPDTPAKPANFLLFGHDNDGNSDTMMVVHVDPAVPVPLVVSFPRDLMVNIPGYSGVRQLNSAYGLGGAGLLTKTLETDFHFPIQHYLQVDFATFPQIVNAIGHVDIWFPTPVHDPYVGLNIDQAGCVSMDGVTALAYARSRHYYVPDDIADPAPWSWDYPAQQGGQGWTAIGSDIERIPREQYFLRTLAQTAISKTNDDPLRIFGLVDAVMSHLTTDQNLTLNELKALVLAFRGVKPADVNMTTLPWAPDPTNSNRVIVKYPDATPVLDRLANFTPPAPFVTSLLDPHTITIRVVNGSGIAGLATEALHSLVAAGFHSAGPVEVAAGATYAHTQVRWAPGKDNPGVTVVYATGAQHFGQSPTTADTLGGDVLVIVGRDWTTIEHHLSNLPHTPPTTQPHPTTTTTHVPTTTATTFDPRFMPVNPKTGGILVGCPTS